MSGDDGTADVLEVGDWNQLVSAVSDNSKAIKELQAVPDALSELKALVTQLIPDNSDDEFQEGGCYGYSPDDADDIEGTVNELLMANKPEETDASLQDILNQTQTEPEYGANLQSDIAQSFSRLINKKVNKETLQKWKDQYKPPDNCRTLGIPRVNHEIWSALPNKTRQIDVHLQTLQASVSMTSVALAKLAEKVVTDGSQLPGKWQQELLQTILECATINSITNQGIISQRKKDIRPALSKEASAICGSNNVTTELLFGENVQEEIKASKSALNVVKPKTFKTPVFRGNYRSQPYSFGRYPGNFQRPPPPLQRGGPRPRFQGRRPQYQPRVFKPSASSSQQSTET